MRKCLALITSLLVLVACQGGDSGNVAELLESGEAHLDAGEYLEAIADLEMAVEADPSNTEAHLLLGQAYNWTGDLMKARDEFSTVLAFDPESAAAHHNLGVVYFQMGDADAALKELEAALTLDPDDADTHYLLGVVYLNQAMPQENAQGPPDAALVDLAITEFETALTLREIWQRR